MTSPEILPDVVLSPAAAWPAKAVVAGGSSAPASRGGAGAGERSRLPLVLLTDDDTVWRAGLACYFRANGFDCAEFGDFTALADFLRSADSLFVIVADLTVGSRHLFDCLTDFAHLWGTAVLVLSSQRDETETIVALELGADDVIGKSTDRREVLARVRAAARRLQTRHSLLRPPPGGPQAEPGAKPPAWRFLPDRRELTDPQGRPVLLTTAEFKLLEAFVANTGRPLHRRDLSATVLGRPYDVSDRSIDNLVAKLRRKLGDPAKQARMIKTARPLGYVFIGLTAPTDRALRPARPAEPAPNAGSRRMIKQM